MEHRGYSKVLVEPLSWRRVLKQSMTAAGVNSGNIAAATTADITTTGIKPPKLLPFQALHIIRYACGIGSQASSRGFVLITPPCVMVQISPFGASHSIANYQDPYIPQMPSASTATSGSFPATPGETITLMDDWYEYDDYYEVIASSPALQVQVQTTVTVRNASGAGDSVNSGPEFLLFEIFENLRKTLNK